MKKYRAKKLKIQHKVPELSLPRSITSKIKPTKNTIPDLIIKVQQQAIRKVKIFIVSCVLSPSILHNLLLKAIKNR